jgi:hypothetical protein
MAVAIRTAGFIDDKLCSRSIECEKPSRIERLRKRLRGEKKTDNRRLPERDQAPTNP